MNASNEKFSEPTAPDNVRTTSEGRNTFCESIGGDVPRLLPEPSPPRFRLSAKIFVLAS